MEKNYKLFRVRELADNDEEFIVTLAAAFLEEVPEDLDNLKKAVDKNDYYSAYQAAHKMKPTVDLFELGVLDDLIEVQDWGKYEKTDTDISDSLAKVVTAIESSVAEIKADFSL
ncbi:Hpt domain-containing protein [Bizionia sp. KMM 8389]